MTSGQETERVHSYNPGARTGPQRQVFNTTAAVFFKGWMSFLAQHQQRQSTKYILIYQRTSLRDDCQQRIKSRQILRDGSGEKVHTCTQQYSSRRANLVALLPGWCNWIGAGFVPQNHNYHRSLLTDLPWFTLNNCNLQTPEVCIN